LNKLKQLAADILEEGKKQDFEFNRNKDLMKSLAETLTQQRSIISYEFRESGLLEALMMYITMTPKQIELHCEKKKSLASGEEVKHSEEI